MAVLRNRLMTGVVVLVSLVAITGCGGNIEQPPEAADTLDRTVEEIMVVSEQPAGEADVDLEQPAEEVHTLALRGWVTVDAYHYDEATGTYIHFYHDESSNDVVSIGLDWIEGELGGDSPTATSAQYISLSLDATSPAAGWTQIPTEIAAGGLTRALGAYADTGTGNWTITKMFTATTGHSNVQLTGLNWASSGDSNLLAANTFTPVTLADQDSLTITWALSLSNP